MRHKVRRTSELIALTLLALSLSPPPIAMAQTANAALRGEYSMSVTRTCALNNGGVLGPFVVRGMSTYDGAGSGTFTGEFLQTIGGSGPPGTGVDAGGGTEIFVTRANQTCTLTYTINADGTFTGTMNCNLSYLLGGPPPAPGQTATLNGIKVNGQLALDGTMLVLASTEASTNTPETFTITSGTNAGFTNKRICATNGMATSRR